MGSRLREEVMMQGGQATPSDAAAVDCERYGATIVVTCRDLARAEHARHLQDLLGGRLDESATLQVVDVSRAVGICPPALEVLLGFAVAQNPVPRCLVVGADNLVARQLFDAGIGLHVRVCDSLADALGRPGEDGSADAGGRR